MSLLRRRALLAASQTGGRFGEPFSFYIANHWLRPNYIEYTALEGMTWENWVNSEYNIDNFICTSFGDEIVIQNIDGLFVIYRGSSVSPADIINANTQYDIAP